ncbi:uncharacterized protein BYT42DRAFT_544318 [Radiomyces spectabilis]|uniref:uncharacterized protein n=1 Tax=Radiomyces spectabilis TaxID=64574 RepID=UPI00221F7EAB|nr:uncharacterized protein BYT42DRAFT_544318 [Radiomyces spectabilis]KAI8384411.1 hypothetical protein BYT42DRAFT_544318 [Radiomyces spectabilis]
MSNNEGNIIVLLKKVCPYCDKTYQSNQKAINHIAATHQKKVQRLLTGHRNFGVYTQANVQKYEQLGYSITIHYGCVSCKQTFVVKEELRKHCDQNHVMASQPENGIITAPDDIIKTGWIFRCPDNDHLFFQNIDITKRFHEFRHHVKTIIDEPRLLTYESHVQHVLALSSILLLKPSRTNSDLHQFIEPEICEDLIEYLLDEYGIRSCEFDQYVRLDAENIVKNCIRKKVTTFQDSQRMMALMVASNGAHNKILLCFRNLTSVANDEWKSSDMSLLQARPDSTISMVIGTEIGQTLGYGEVKPASQTMNHKLVGKDFVRLALLAKNAIDRYHSKFVLSFLVVGHHATFYLTDGTRNGFYPMVEIAHIQLPMSLKELPLFIAQADQLAMVSSAFWNLCVDQKPDQQSLIMPTLSDNEIASIMDIHTNRKRKAHTSHHHH